MSICLEQWFLTGGSFALGDIWQWPKILLFVIIDWEHVVREDFPGGSVVKNPPAVQEMWVRSLFQEDPLEEGMAIHSSILAWRIPWKEEPAWLSSIRSQRVGRDWSDLACMQACSGWRPEMMLSVLWCTNRTSQQKNYLTQIVNSSEVENHWSRISMNLGIICPFVHVF